MITWKPLRLPPINLWSYPKMNPNKVNHSHLHDEHYEDKIKRMIDEGKQKELSTCFNLYKYQKFTASTAVYPAEHAYEYLTAGLGAEVGEVLDHFAKAWRGDKALNEQEVLKEIGDVMWFVANLVDVMGYDLSLVLENNMKKLKDRQERGVLKGSGDNR